MNNRQAPQASSKFIAQCSVYYFRRNANLLNSFQMKKFNIFIMGKCSFFNRSHFPIFWHFRLLNCSNFLQFPTVHFHFYNKFLIKMSSSFDSTIVWLIERTAFGFVLITLPFYSLILVVIGWECFRNSNANQSQKNLNSPFFRLMFVTGIVDITTLLNNYFGSVFPKWGLFPSIYLNAQLESILSRLYIGLAWGTGLSHTICVFAVALNRMVAILTLFKYKKIWNANVTRLLCAFQILPGIGICAMIFKDPTHYVLQTDGISIVARNFDESATSLYFLIGAICTAVGCFLSAITYAISFIKLYQYRRKLPLLSSNNHQTMPRRSSSLNSHLNSRMPYTNRQSLAQINNSVNFSAGVKQQIFDQQRNKQRAEEMRLFMLALIICLVEFILAALLALHNFVQNPLWIAAFNLLTDLFSAINPYLLWAFSQPLRQKTMILLIGFPGPYKLNLTKWRKKMVPTQPQTPAANGAT